MFDDDSAVEGVLELIVALLCVLDGFACRMAMLAMSVQRLGELHIGVGHRSVVDRNRLRAPITVPSSRSGSGVGGLEPGAHGTQGESRPLLECLSQFGVDDRLSR